MASNVAGDLDLEGPGPGPAVQNTRIRKNEVRSTVLLLATCYLERHDHVVCMPYVCVMCAGDLDLEGPGPGPAVHNT